MRGFKRHNHVNGEMQYRSARYQTLLDGSGYAFMLISMLLYNYGKTSSFFVFLSAIVGLLLTMIKYHKHHCLSLQICDILFLILGLLCVRWIPIQVVAIKTIMLIQITVLYYFVLIYPEHFTR